MLPDGRASPRAETGSLVPSQFHGITNAAHPAILTLARSRCRPATPDRTSSCWSRWGSAIPAMKVMVETVPPLAGAALVFLLGGLVLCVARPRAARRPRASSFGTWPSPARCSWWAGKGLRRWR